MDVPVGALWRGPGFAADGLLVLAGPPGPGEPPEAAALARDAIAAPLDSLPPFARRLTQGLCAAEAPGPAERAEAWNTLAFARCGPGGQDAAALLRALAPHGLARILVCGIGLWRGLPAEGWRWTGRPLIGFYRLGGAPVLCRATLDPGARWHPGWRVLSSAVWMLRTTDVPRR